MNRPLSRASVCPWISGRRKFGIMLTVDERQFEMRYAPIACGLQLLVVSCALGSLVAALWYFLFR
jgi:hypothetical protein